MADVWDSVNLPSAPSGGNNNQSSTATKAGGFDNSGILDWAKEVDSQTAGKQLAQSNPAQHVFNPQVSGNQNNTPVPSQSLWGNFGSSLVDMGKGVVSAFTGSDQKMGDPFVGGTKTQGQQYVEPNYQQIAKGGAFNSISNNAITEVPSAITKSLYGVATPVLQAISQIGKATGHSGEINLPKELTAVGLPNVDSFSNEVEKDMRSGMPGYQAVIKQIPNIIGAGLALDAAATKSSLKLGDLMQEKTSTPITFKDMQNITTGKTDLVDPEVLKAYKTAAAENPELLGQIRRGTINVPSAPKATVFSNFLKNAATRPISEISNIFNTFGRDTSIPGTKLLGNGQPEPFSQESTAPPQQATQPFTSNEPQVDQTHEAFTGNILNQLPDKVVRVDGGFYTIPIDTAGTTIAELGGAVISKSPSQLEMQGIKNLGPVQVPTAGPETSTALATKEGQTPQQQFNQQGSANPGAAIDDIKKTIQAFRDNAAAKQEGIRLRTNFTGNRDARIAQDNQLFESLKHVMPNPLDQEALSLTRPFADKPGELRQFLDGTHPEYQKIADEYAAKNPDATPAQIAAVKQAAIKRVSAVANVIKQALNPNASMYAVNQALTDYSKGKLAEGQELGILDSSIKPENYVPQHTTPVKQTLSNRLNKLSSGKLGTPFSAAQERVFASPLHALAWGAQPKSLNVFDNFSLYAEGHATAAATKEFLQSLKDNQLAKFQNDANVPKDWEDVRIKKGQTIYLPKELADAIRPLVEKNAFTPGKFITNLTAYQQYLKGVEVSLSIFHAKALAITATADIGPVKAATVPFIDMESPAFKQQELDFIRDGGQTSILGKTVEAKKLLNGSSLPSRGAALKTLPGAKQLMGLSDKITRMTFEVQQRGYKVISYSVKKAAWLAKNPTATPEQIRNAGIDIAKQVNSVYGGLNWESLGVSKTARKLAKVFTFAPDWTYSNILSAKYAFGGGPAGSASRSFWFKSMVGGMVATQLMSYAITHQKSKKPFMVYLGKDKNGKEMYSNMFFVGGPGDMVKWVQNVQQYGAVTGTFQTLGNKAQAVVRAGIHQITGRNYQGQPITIKGASPVVNTARGAKQIGEDLLPVPFTGSNIYNLLNDPNKEASFWDYLNILGGSTTSHVIPEGSHVPTTGKQKGQVVQDKPGAGSNRQQLPLLQQIETGKQYESTPTSAGPRKRTSR